MLLEAANQLLGGTVEPTSFDTRRNEPAAARPGRSAAESAKLLEHALEQFESTLGKMDDRGSNSDGASHSNDTGDLRSLAREIEDALDQVRHETRRLTDEASRLTLIAERLETRFEQAEAASAVVGGGRSEPQRLEPRFQPNDEPFELTLSAVPGFQGLMDAQRMLSGMAEVEGASVTSYKNGEASLELTLVEALSASEIVEQLEGASGHRMLIEEARPADGRLRLRFID